MWTKRRTSFTNGTDLLLFLGSLASFYHFYRWLHNVFTQFTYFLVACQIFHGIDISIGGIDGDKVSFPYKT